MLTARIHNSELETLRVLDGGLAQLARAPALQAGGQRFESVILHQTVQMMNGTFIFHLSTFN